MFLEFYGINEQPFGVTPDPRFLYMAPAYQEAFASLVYGIETGRGFMALIAAPGLGKTTLVLRLMENLQRSAQAAFLFQTHTSSHEFIKNLLLDLNVEPAGKDLSDLQAQLQQVLIQGLNSGKRLVPVIDEAQNLDDSVLEMARMLSNFETPHTKLLQIILVGQPALANKLMQPNLAQLRQRISIIAYFSPLRGREIARYIQFRLRKAGCQGLRLFTSRAMALIAFYSRGIPRNINNLCFNALSLGYAKGQKRIDKPIIREVIADLKLESLGEPPGNPRIGVPPLATSATPQIGGHPPSPPAANPCGILDEVDISEDSPAFRGGDERQSRHSSPGWTVVALALATLCAFVWRSSWLKPASSFVVWAMSRVPSSANKLQDRSANNSPAGFSAPTESAGLNPAPDDTPGAPMGIAGDSHPAISDTPMPSRTDNDSPAILGGAGNASTSEAGGEPTIQPPSMPLPPN